MSMTLNPMQKATLIACAVMVVIVVGGMVAAASLGGGPDDATPTPSPAASPVF